MLLAAPEDVGDLDWQDLIPLENADASRASQDATAMAVVRSPGGQRGKGRSLGHWSLSWEGSTGQKSRSKGILKTVSEDVDLIPLVNPRAFPASY